MYRACSKCSCIMAFPSSASKCISSWNSTSRTCCWPVLVQLMIYNAGNAVLLQLVNVRNSWCWNSFKSSDTLHSQRFQVSPLLPKPHLFCLLGTGPSYKVIIEFQVILIINCVEQKEKSFFFPLSFWGQNELIALENSNGITSIGKSILKSFTLSKENKN